MNSIITEEDKIKELVLNKKFWRICAVFLECLAMVIVLFLPVMKMKGSSYDIETAKNNIESIIYNLDEVDCVNVPNQFCNYSYYLELYEGSEPYENLLGVLEITKKGYITYREQQEINYKMAKLQEYGDSNWNELTHTFSDLPFQTRADRADTLIHILIGCIIISLIMTIGLEKLRICKIPIVFFTAVYLYTAFYIMCEADVNASGPLDDCFIGLSSSNVTWGLSGAMIIGVILAIMATLLDTILGDKLINILGKRLDNKEVISININNKGSDIQNTGASVKEALTKNNAEKPGLSKSCRKCGAPLSQRDKFCGRCGRPVELEQTYENVMYCQSCGNKLKAEARFCPQCGSEIQKLKVQQK